MENQAMKWVRYNNLPLPDILKTSGWDVQKDKEGYDITDYWIIYRKTDIPKDFPLNNKGENIINWISHRIDDIPDILKFPNWQYYQSNYSGNFPFMHWIIFRKTDIPEEMKFPDWQYKINKRKQTALFFWILHKKTDIPEDMLYNNWQESKFGCFNGKNIWLMHRNDELLPGMSIQEIFNDLCYLCSFYTYSKFKVHLQKYNNLEQWFLTDEIEIPECYKNFISEYQDAIHLWIRFKNDIPDILKTQNWQTKKDRYGRTPLFYWIYIKGNIPSQEFFYKGWDQDVDNDEKNFLQYIIEFTNLEISEFFDRNQDNECDTPDYQQYILHQNKFGYTAAQTWIKFRDQRLPEILEYNGLYDDISWIIGFGYYRDKYL